MTTEPEALRLAREIVGLDDRLGSRMLSSERGPARVARALISAEAVVKAAREEHKHLHSPGSPHDPRLCYVCKTIAAHDAALTPPSSGEGGGA